MPSYYLSPIGNDQQIDSNGAPLSGGKIYTYLAGTSTPSATYTDNTGATPQANPIILNSLGLPASPIWLLGGFPLKFIIKDSADTTIRTVDNISGVNDTASTASEWTSSGLTPTYISATQFSVTGDQTAIFQVNRRVRTTNTGGLIYGRITVTSFGAGITTVTVVNDTGSMDAGLSAVAYGFLSFTPSSVPYNLYQNVGDSSQTVSKVQAISASVAASALTISASATILDFRSSTLASGAVTTVSGTPANLVISSGSTLGTTSAVQSRIAVLALNNAGTIELAAINVAGGVDLSETGLISTTAEGGAGAADSITVAYSTTARSNVAYRVIGYIESTQATAGTWATAPSTIQGQGGNSRIGIAPLFGIRAYVSFDGNRNAAGGTDAAFTARFIRSSGNVTSVTKIASGQYTVVMTTAMPDAEYGVFGGTNANYGTRGAGGVSINSTPSWTESAPSTTTFTVTFSDDASAMINPKYGSLFVCR